MRVIVNCERLTTADLRVLHLRPVNHPIHNRISPALFLDREVSGLPISVLGDVSINENSAQKMDLSREMPDFGV